MCCAGLRLQAKLRRSFSPVLLNKKTCPVPAGVQAITSKDLTSSKAAPASRERDDEHQERRGAGEQSGRRQGKAIRQRNMERMQESVGDIRWPTWTVISCARRGGGGL